MNFQTVLFVTLLFGSELQASETANRIGPGDILEVRIAVGLDQDSATQFPVRVDENGMTFLPELGEVRLAGLQLTEAEKAIATACINRGIWRHPHVTVTMRQPRRNRVTVIGAVKTPGVYELPRSATCWDALVAADGLTEDGGPNIEIRQSKRAGHRDGLLSWDVRDRDDRRALVNTFLHDGSVVVVKKQPPGRYHR